MIQRLIVFLCVSCFIFSAGFSQDVKAPIGLTATKRYLLMNLSGPRADWCTLVYDKKKQSFFSIQSPKDCFFNEKRYMGVENNLSGIQPYSVLRSTHNNQWVNLMQMVDLKNYLDLDCWKEQTVIDPKYRQELMQIIENSDMDDNPIVRIVQLKK